MTDETGNRGVFHAMKRKTGLCTPLAGMPTRAIGPTLERQAWAVSDPDVVEIGQAFAAVDAVSSQALGVHPGRLEPDACAAPPAR